MFLSSKNLLPKIITVLLTVLCSLLFVGDLIHIQMYIYVFVSLEFLQKWEHFFHTVQKLTCFERLSMSVHTALLNSFDWLHNSP